MPYYDVVNLETVTKTNMINEMPCGCRNLRTTAVRIWHKVSCRACTVVSAALVVSRRPALRARLLSKCPTDLCRGPRSSKIWLFYKSNLVASWMHLYNCRCFQEHLSMLLQSLRALSKAPGGPGSIWKYLEALVRATGVSGKFACGFQTILYSADVRGCRSELLWLCWPDIDHNSWCTAP